MTDTKRQLEDLRQNAKVQSFTDDEIEVILEESDNFRLFGTALRNKYLQSMREGWWGWVSGEPLIFNNDNHLINGQHRLGAAQVWQRETGKEAWFLCIHGVDRKEAIFMDDVKNRTLTEYMHHAKVKHAVSASTMTRMMAIMNLAKDSQTIHPLVIGGVNIQARIGGKVGANILRPSLPQCIDIFRRFRGEILRWAGRHRALARARLPKPCFVTGLVMMLSRGKHVQQGVEFIEALASGANLARDNPAWVLREKLLASQVNPLDRLPHLFVAAYVVKSWNAWVRGFPLKRLAFTTHGKNIEPFPSHKVTIEIE